MKQRRENQPEILIHGKTAYEDDARLDTVIVPVHGVFVRGLGEPVPGQKVHQRIQHLPDDFGEEIRPFGLRLLFLPAGIFFCSFRLPVEVIEAGRNTPDVWLS